MTNNHRSATVSPSSENSPSQDMQSEEGSYPHPGGGGFNQYSSQDSLPDSPYSSQSLDSQPAPGQGKQRFSGRGTSLFPVKHEKFPPSYIRDAKNFSVVKSLNSGEARASPASPVPRPLFRLFLSKYCF